MCVCEREREREGGEGGQLLHSHSCVRCSVGLCNCAHKCMVASSFSSAALFQVTDGILKIYRGNPGSDIPPVLTFPLPKGDS